MAFKRSVHMNPGEGETSYARNSTFQKIVQGRMKTLIEEVVIGLLAATCTTQPSNMVIADLGCSSGPNALTLVSAAVDAIYRHCVQHGQLPPEMCVFLNDLPDNDFSTVAKSLAVLKNNTKDFSRHPVMIAGMIPGSFYERLFPCGSLHFVSSSNSLLWLSKAPEDLKMSGIPMYDSNENLRLSRRQIVADAYAPQLREDFTLFLNLRAQELARRTNGYLTEVISKEKLDSFYIPMYSPLDKEVNDIIEDEDSFKIHKMLMPSTIDEVDRALVNPKIMALAMRAAFEPTIVQHFGSSEEIMDEFMRKSGSYPVL